MSGQVSRGSAGEYQADERAGVVGAGTFLEVMYRFITLILVRVSWGLCVCPIYKTAYLKYVHILYISYSSLLFNH